MWLHVLEGYGRPVAIAYGITPTLEWCALSEAAVDVIEQRVSGDKNQATVVNDG